jgi:hypothetical protein
MKQIKTIKALAKELCKRESGKKQVDIAQMTEILGRLSDILFEHSVDQDDGDLREEAEYLLDFYKEHGPYELDFVLEVNGAKRFLKASKGKK